MKNKLKMPNSIIAKFWPLILSAIVLPVIWHLWSSTGGGDSTNMSTATFDDDLQVFLGDIHENWTEGFSQKDVKNSSCDFEGNEASCSYELMSCYLKNQLNRKPLKLGHKFVLVETSSVKSNFGDAIIQINELKTQKNFTIKLFNNCHRIKLPQNIYSSGPVKTNELIWDNYNQKIWIDRFYRTMTETSGKEVPLLQLTISDRIKYCQERGGQLLESHVFDAASFYPSKTTPRGTSYKFRYPWGREDIDFSQVDKVLCEKLQAKECLSAQLIRELSRVPTGVSWSGIFYAIGSYPESFRNIINPMRNLKVSSRFQSFTSEWHENGLRAYWNGTLNYSSGIELTEKILKRMIPSGEIKGIAFRCMYYQ